MKIPGFPQTDPQYADGSMGAVVCPACGEATGMHVDTAFPFKGNDSYDAADTGIDVRGDVIVIPMWCEFGDHPSEIRIGAHKGMVFVNTEVRD